MRTLKLIWAHLRVGVMNELQYRVNFFIQLIQTFTSLGVGLVGLWLGIGGLGQKGCQPHFGNGDAISLEYSFDGALTEQRPNMQGAKFG